MKIQAGRADVNAMMRKVAQQISADRAEARKRRASGDDTAHNYDQRDQIAVMQTVIGPRVGDPLREPRTRWETMGEMPFGLQPIVVIGSQSEALANKWTLKQLLTRRLHRAYRNALEGGKIMPTHEANARAKRADIYVASMEFGGNG